MSDRSSTVPTVLVVDDSPIVLETTRAALEAAGYRVLTRSRGGGTVAVVLRDRPDLVLLDVRMPQFNGDTIAGILTRSDSSRSTIVLLYSSYPPEILEQKVAQTGAHGFIRKTDNPAELVSQVNRWLKGRRGAHPVPPPRSKPISATRVAALLQPSTTHAGIQRSADSERAVKVFFVDDDAANLTAYRAAQSEGHFYGEVASSMEQALERIMGPEPPDVVVGNLALLGSDAVRLYEQALSVNRSWRRRFLFVSDAVAARRSAAFLAAAGDQVLYMPVDVNSLIRAVRFASIAARVGEPRAAEPDAEARSPEIARRR